MKNLSNLSGAELKKFLNSFDDVLFDCDGVLHVGGSSVPGASESLLKLKQYEKRIRFVSNNCFGGSLGIQAKIKSSIYQAEVYHIAYPTLAIISYLKKINFGKGIFVLGSKAMKKEFVDAGFFIANSTPKIIEETLKEFTDSIGDVEDVGAVVIDFDFNLNYINIVKSLVYLQKPDVLFIVGATDKSGAITANSSIIGPGYFQDILSTALGRAPIVFGKPARHFNEFIVEKFEIKNAGRTLFVGDSLEQDMAFAHQNGYQKLLTLTGVTSLKTLENCTSEAMLPHFYLDSFGDLSHLIKHKLEI